MADRQPITPPHDGALDSKAHSLSDIDDKPLKGVFKDAELVTSRGNIVTKDGVVLSTEDSSTSLSTNIFSDPEVKAHFINVYEKAQYECRHVFDAEAEWTEEEEKKLVRRLDARGSYPKTTSWAWPSC